MIITSNLNYIDQKNLFRTIFIKFWDIGQFKTVGKQSPKVRKETIIYQNKKLNNLTIDQSYTINFY